jgi:hypothetical protein
MQAHRSGMMARDWKAVRDATVLTMRAEGFAATPMKARGIYQWAERLMRHAQTGQSEPPILP